MSLNVLPANIESEGHLSLIMVRIMHDFFAKAHPFRSAQSSAGTLPKFMNESLLHALRTYGGDYADYRATCKCCDGMYETSKCMVCSVAFYYMNLARAVAAGHAVNKSMLRDVSNFVNEQYEKRETQREKNEQTRRARTATIEKKQLEARMAAHAQDLERRAPAIAASLALASEKARQQEQLKQQDQKGVPTSSDAGWIDEGTLLSAGLSPDIAALVIKTKDEAERSIVRGYLKAGDSESITELYEAFLPSYIASVSQPVEEVKQEEKAPQQPGSKLTRRGAKVLSSVVEKASERKRQLELVSAVSDMKKEQKRQLAQERQRQFRERKRKLQAVDVSSSDDIVLPPKNKIRKTRTSSDIGEEATIDLVFQATTDEYQSTSIHVHADSNAVVSVAPVKDVIEASGFSATLQAPSAVATDAAKQSAGLARFLAEAPRKCFSDINTSEAWLIGKVGGGILGAFNDKKLTELLKNPDELSGANLFEPSVFKTPESLAIAVNNAVGGLRTKIARSVVTNPQFDSATSDTKTRAFTCDAHDLAFSHREKPDECLNKMAGLWRGQQQQDFYLRSLIAESIYNWKTVNPSTTVDAAYDKWGDMFKLRKSTFKQMCVLGEVIKMAPAFKSLEQHVYPWNDLRRAIGAIRTELRRFEAEEPKRFAVIWRQRYQALQTFF
jgi:hypothetical protein